MLKRVLEPEVMDTPEEALDYDSMDHRGVNEVFVSDLLGQLPADAPRTSAVPSEVYDAEFDGTFLEVLDLGTGTAQIPIELCGRREDVRVMAVDLAASMLDVALANVEVAGLRERIMLDLVDAKQLPYEDDRFGCVMSNSIVHHIPEPVDVLREAWRVLAPGGLAFLRDLLRPATDEEVRHLVDTYAAGANDHQRQMFEDSLRAALTVEEVRQLAAESGIDDATIEPTTDRHWTLFAVKP